jgi:hypothetical protein
MNKAAIKRFFGPGTILALGFLAIYFYAGPKQEAPKPRRLQAQTSESIPPLWKPEPAFLISQAETLGLESRQVEAIRSLDIAWQKEKSRLLAEMERFQGEVQDRSTEPGLRSQMEEYSDLSRAFDSARRSYWGAAEDLLTLAQAKRLQEIKEERR